MKTENVQVIIIVVFVTEPANMFFFLLLQLSRGANSERGTNGTPHLLRRNPRHDHLHLRLCDDNSRHHKLSRPDPVVRISVRVSVEIDIASLVLLAFVTTIGV